MNKMENIARSFGLELGDEFHIDGEGSCIFRLMEHGLDRFIPGKECTWDQAPDEILRMILTGEFEVIKLPKKPWMPNKYETYYSVAGHGGVFSTVFSENDSCDICRAALGFAFKTKEEVEANKEKVLEQYRQIISGEVIGKLVRPDGFDPDTARMICEWLRSESMYNAAEKIERKFGLEESE